MKNYTNDEIKKIALEKYSKDYEMLQGQINWFIKGFREALSQHDVSGRSEQLCRTFFPDGRTSSATKCQFCGKEKWEH